MLDWLIETAVAAAAVALGDALKSKTPDSPKTPDPPKVPDPPKTQNKPEAAKEDGAHKLPPVFRPTQKPVPVLNSELLKTRFYQIEEYIVAEMAAIAASSLQGALDPHKAAATLAWKDVSPEKLPDLIPAGADLPETIRVGQICHSDLVDDLDKYGLPLYLPVPKCAMLAVFSGEDTLAVADDLIQSFALRLALCLPLGSAKIHLIDLQTKGRALAQLGALDQRIAPLAPSDVEDRVRFFKEMAKRTAEISRRCLSRFDWLSEFNRSNPEEAAEYHFICISGFSEAIEKEVLSALQDLAKDACASRCGIHIFLSLPGQDSGKEHARFLNCEDVFRVSLCKQDRGIVADRTFSNAPSGQSDSSGEYSVLTYVADLLPDHTQDLIDTINTILKEKPKQKRISVNISDSHIWKSTTSSGVKIPIGKTGRDEVCFQLGNDAVVHHALIGGATGTGKTVLLHNIILNAAELYSPEDLQMILMDFKEGTEFACYEGLPHMRVLSVASELHFGSSVFEWLVAERMRRAGLFKKVGAANLGDYIGKSGSKIPRILVVMDEFQRILADPVVGSQVSMLLDDIVRTGRSFGINLVLSTQSLANVRLESSTLTSVGLRICMRLSERETSQFLNYDNTLPTSFSRAGQALYNDSEGRKEGNKEFQVGFVEVSEIPARCEALRKREMERYGKRIVDNARVFQGEAPVDPSKGLPPSDSDHLAAFLGIPLKLDASPLEIVFEQRDGAHLIAAAQSFDILNTLSVNIATQLLQRPVPPEILVMDGLPLSRERWSWSVGAGRGVSFLATSSAMSEALERLVAEVEARKLEGQDRVFEPKVLFLLEPQGMKAFPVSTTGEASPAALKFQFILEQGGRFGIHVLLMTSRLARTDKVLGNFGRLDLKSFGMRIAFQSDDAESLIFDASTKSLGTYSGILMDELSGETTPFQIYDKFVS